LIIFYVDRPEASAAFYAGLLGRPVVESSPTFAMLPLQDGLMLGLWARPSVLPPSGQGQGVAELCLPLADAAAVDALHATWQAQGLTVLQAPTTMAFGRTFVVADPDGHRLRMFAPAA
jgi:predicted enzyme related to lactoylglutathione lyase